MNSLKLLFFGFTSCLILVNTRLIAQTDPSDPEVAVMKKVADNILAHTTYDFRIVDEDRVVRPPLDVSMIRPSIRPNSPYNEWTYWNGVLNIAMLRMAKLLNEPKYMDFAVKNYRFVFDNLPALEKYTGERKWYYPFSTLTTTEQLDDCGAIGAGLIEVNQITPRKDYETYLNTAATHMLTRQTRLADGTYSRIVPHNMTIWADDLYMSIVFLSRMGKWTGQDKYFNDAILQVENMTKYLYNPNTELYFHCWYDDLKVNGVAHWGRCNGWVMMAQVELLDHLPVNHPKRDELIRFLQQQIRGISRYQDITGLWHQLLNKNDSYLETSCTAMFTYSIVKAVNNGWLDKGYITVALEGWEGVKTHIQDDGQVKNICMGTGIENDLIFYYKRPAPLNDIHGLGAVLLAGSEIVKYRMNNPQTGEEE